MRLLVFVIFIGVAAVVIGVASYMAGANAWTITWRVVATLVVLQIAYFLLLVLVSILLPPKPGPSGEDQKDRVNPLAKAQKH